ncbi:MAG: hypothetical protein HYS44_00095 [Candidatus Niyogibacteria bacterium]|nr:hypothetical protein [Candidatus Niyogibacteria bacterium]
MGVVKIILPALALTLGVLTSVYFVVQWWRQRDGRRERALLLWALALFLMYWFQVPAILSGLGKTITVTDFNLFFALTFPITFLALIFIYIGILQISGIRLGKKQMLALSAWFLAAILFFAYQFIVNKGVIQTYLLPLMGNLFYIFIRALIVFTVIRLLIRPEMQTRVGILGAAAIVTESILGLARNFFIIDQVLTYPPQFWYLAIASSQFFFVTQTLSIILLVFGFYFLHRLYRGSPEIHQ